MFWLLKNRFESLKEGFELLENVLAIGNRIRILERRIRIASKYFSYWNFSLLKSFLEKGIRIAQRGIRIAKTFFFTTKNFSENKDSNRLTQKCMNALENARKCSTNIQFHSSYRHTTQKDLTNMNI